MKRHHLPLISVIMATFNEDPNIISEAINSVLQQTYRNFELLIFDDSTNKETKKIIDLATIDQRVHVFRFPKRLGFVKSLNIGLKSSKGKYIARMDGDDISLPFRFEKQINYLETHKDIVAVGGQINIIDKHNAYISNRVYPTAGIRLSLFSCIRSPMAHPTVMMRREIIDKNFQYDETLIRAEDLDLWLRLMNSGYRIANLPDIILNYRITDNFTEKRSSNIQRKCMAYVRKRNFSNKRLVYSIISGIFGWIFMHIPSAMIKQLYTSENREKQKSTSKEGWK